MFVACTYTCVYTLVCTPPLTCVFLCRWALFPPTTPKHLVQVTKEEGGSQRDEAIAWFALAFPRTQQPDWPKEYAPVSAFY